MITLEEIASRLKDKSNYDFTVNKERWEPKRADTYVLPEFNIKESQQSDECYIVIVGSQEKKIGVMVDALIGEEDVVIKPLRDQFTNSPGIAGASILGDGSVSLIIDVGQLLELGIQQEILTHQEEVM